MARDWLNVFIYQSGASPASEWVKASDIAQLNGQSIRIFESDRSGAMRWTTVAPKLGEWIKRSDSTPIPCELSPSCDHPAAERDHEEVGELNSRSS